MGSPCFPPPGWSAPTAVGAPSFTQLTSDCTRGQRKRFPRLEKLEKEANVVCHLMAANSHAIVIG
jgi:hypothetical protein